MFIYEKYCMSIENEHNMLQRFENNLTTSKKESRIK